MQCLNNNKYLIFHVFRQLSVLVNERHTAFARLKTAEDLLEAIRAENEVLHHSLAIGQTGAGHRQPGDHSGRCSHI
jgi:hypothetical protein